MTAISILKTSKNDLISHLNSDSILSAEFLSSRDLNTPTNLSDTILSEYKLFLLSKGIGTIVVANRVPK